MCKYWRAIVTDFEESSRAILRVDDNLMGCEEAAAAAVAANETAAGTTDAASFDRGVYRKYDKEEVKALLAKLKSDALQLQHENKEL